MLLKGLLPALLNFEDRNSMAHGIEGRLPFLDRQFSTLCHTISPEQKIKNGLRKDVFRKAMKDVIPDKILNRKDKVGFLSPQENWMEEHSEHFLTSINEGILNHPHWFDPDIGTFIKEILLKKKRQDYPFVWRVYSFLDFLSL